jgi:hypothetical protein
MDVVLHIPISVVVEDEVYENTRRIAKMLDEVELNLISILTTEIRSQLICAFNELSIVYLASNEASDLIEVDVESYNLPSLSFSVKRFLCSIEKKLNKDLVFLTLTKKMRQALLLFYQRTV